MVSSGTEATMSALRLARGYQAENESSNLKAAITAMQFSLVKRVRSTNCKNQIRAGRSSSNVMTLPFSEETLKRFLRRR